MRQSFIYPLLTLLILLALSGCGAAGDKAPLPSSDRVDFSFDYEKFVLENGLTVLVYEDRTSPQVSVNVTYKVGSKHERQGQFGYAHLFEHLMFDGSENSGGDFFSLGQSLGASGQNGSTDRHRTSYYTTVPSNALEQLLFLESDRMGHFLGALSQKKLDEQRGVVKNEKRVSDDKPFRTRVDKVVFENLYAVGHPYHHLTIGSYQDLNNASLEDARAWFTQYYGAANAVLTITGDIDVGTAKNLAEKYFGHIASGPPLAKDTVSWQPLRTNKYSTMYDNVDTARLYRYYIAPPIASKHTAEMTLLARMLGEGNASLLRRRLVDDLQIASNIYVNYNPQVVSGELQIQVTPRSSGDIKKINTVIDEEVAKLMETQVAPEDVQLSKMSYFIEEASITESAFGKGWKLTQGEVFVGNSEYYLVDFPEAIQNANPESINKTAVKIFENGYLELAVLPFNQKAKSSSVYDRSKGLPPLGKKREPQLPAITDTSLSNGIKVVTVEPSEASFVQVEFHFDAGEATHLMSGSGRKISASALSHVAVDMLDAGTSDYTSQELTRQAALMGASIRPYNRKDSSHIRLTALKSDKMGERLELLEQILFDSKFSDDELENTKQLHISDILRDKSITDRRGGRMLMNTLYGLDHPYAKPETIAQEIEDTESLTSEDVKAWQQAWLRPDNLTIFVAGGEDPTTIISELERIFGSWTVSGNNLLKKELPIVQNSLSPKVIVIDQQNLKQSNIIAGKLIEPAGKENYTAIQAVNDIFGGTMTSRLNLNLREDKGWTYGAHSAVTGWTTGTHGIKGQRIFAIQTSVQIDRTADSIAEIIKEIEQFTSTKPISIEDLNSIRKTVAGRQVSVYEETANIIQSLMYNSAYGLSLDYAKDEVKRYNNLSVNRLREIAADIVKLDELQWVIVGDWAVIEEEVRALNLGPIEVHRTVN